MVLQLLHTQKNYIDWNFSKLKQVPLYKSPHSNVWNLFVWASRQFINRR